MDLYLFDLDNTLYAYDFRRRLPRLAELTGVSQYRLAKSWWAAGHERRAEAGDWTSSAEYLSEFARVTGGRRLTLEEWAQARSLAMAANSDVIAVLGEAAQHGTVSLLSNNPSPLVEAFDRLAPAASAILGPNVLASVQLGVRKPDRRAFELAVARYGASADRTFFVDDSLANVEGARSVGITAHHLVSRDGVADSAALREAIAQFRAAPR